LEADVDARVQEFLSLIRTKYLSTDNLSKPMDLGQKTQFFTLDVISTVGLGTSFGMLRSDTDINHYLKSLNEGLFISNILTGTGLYWIAQIPWVASLAGAPTEKDSSGFGKMMATAAKMIDDRLKSPTDTKSDMLAAFIRNGLAGSELKMEVYEQILAGSDTTAGGIRGIILCLLSNPRVYRKLQQEIDAAVRDKGIPSDGIITDSQAKQLEYLQAVIREGLRIAAPIANVFARDVPAGGDTVTVDGKQVFLPGGTWIGYSTLAMHQSEQVFGKDAKMFRPERWLTTDEEMLASMKKVNDLIFGHGRWKCLGQTVAKMELNKIIFEVSLSAPPSIAKLHDSCSVTLTLLWSILKRLGPRSMSWDYSQCRTFSSLSRQDDHVHLMKLVHCFPNIFF
jgi:cytochrome P450